MSQPKLSEMRKNDGFDGFLLVRAAAQRTGQNGKTYLDLTLAGRLWRCERQNVGYRHEPAAARPHPRARHDAGIQRQAAVPRGPDAPRGSGGRFRYCPSGACRARAFPGHAGFCAQPSGRHCRPRTQSAGAFAAGRSGRSAAVLPRGAKTPPRGAQRPFAPHHRYAARRGGHLRRVSLAGRRFARRGRGAARPGQNPRNGFRRDGPRERIHYGGIAAGPPGGGRGRGRPGGGKSWARAKSWCSCSSIC